MHQFELVDRAEGQDDKPIAVKFTSVTATPQIHGEERVRAVYIKVKVEGSNRLLDRIKPGLREYHYMNRALEEAGQTEIPALDPELPDLRQPEVDVGKTHTFLQGGKKHQRGYRFIQDYGLGAEGGSNLDFTDCVVSGIEYETKEGGTVVVSFTVAYNGDLLNDDGVHGRAVGLATEGEGHVMLIAPAQLIEPKKGWRSGHPDAPPPGNQTPEGQGTLDDSIGGDDEDEDQEDLDPNSPEGALAATANQG